MFDTEFDLDDPAAAARTFERLVERATRARLADRFSENADPETMATRFWIMGHGFISLVVNGVLPVSALEDHVPPMTIALFTTAGDLEAPCRRSVRRGWRHFRPPTG